jgi:acyl-CoA thioester hydrolase
MDGFSALYEVRWTDINANRHVRYSAYVDAAAEMRYHFLSQTNFPPQEMERLGMGLVYTSMMVNFYREVLLGETLTLTFALAGLSPQGIRWKVRHDFLKANGKKAVELVLEGAFLNLHTRQPSIPLPGMMAAFQSIPRSADFETMSDNRWFRLKR